MRKNLKKVMAAGVSGLLAAGLLVGSVDYASHMFIMTNRAVAKQVERVSEEIKASSKSGLDSDKTSKQETVYQTLDANGKPTDTVVSDWLKNSGTNSELKDVSGLSDISNTKGDEEFTQNGEELTWNTASEDIYYQGKTDKESPVGIELSYKLDGMDVDVNEIAGKSGKLEINIKYTNSSKKTVKIDGEKTDIYTPFVMVTGMILPVEQFKNISIDNGSVISEGDNNIVVAYGLPGLKESLDLDNLDLGKDVDIDLSKLSDKITDTVKITADVTNFELKSSYTVATSEFFSDIDLDKVEGTDELTDKMDELSDAAKELVNGSDKIDSNLNKLDNKFGDYSDAIHTLNGSVDTLDKGAEKLRKGINSYTNGADQLLEGVITYVDGTKTLAKSTKEYAKNTKKLVNKTGELKTKGTEVLVDGSAQFSKGLNTYVSTINQILSADTLTTVIKGFSAINSGAAQLKDATGQLSAGAGSLKEGMDSINAAAKNITQYNSEVEGYIAELKKLYSEAEDESEKAAIMAIITYVGTAQQAGSGIEAATGAGSDMAAGFAKLLGGLSAVSDGLAEIESKTDADALAGGQAGNLADSLGQLKEAGNTLVSTYDSQLDAGIQKLDENTGALYSAGQTLVSNNKKLADGANTHNKNKYKIKKNIKKTTSKRCSISFCI